MACLLDTNILSEVRKERRAAPSVMAWWATVPENEVFLSVIIIGEIRRGVESVRGRDLQRAQSLERWLNTVMRTFAPRILPVTLEIAERWGRLSPNQPLPAVDALLAATALVHDLTLVTRNVRDVERTGARIFNPFSEA